MLKDLVSELKIELYKKVNKSEILNWKGDGKMKTYDELEVEHWLSALKNELNQITEYRNGKTVDGIDENGYCAGILNHGQPIDDYEEQLKGAIYFIFEFFGIK